LHPYGPANVSVDASGDVAAQSSDRNPCSGSRAPQTRPSTAARRRSRRRAGPVFIGAVTIPG